MAGEKGATRSIIDEVYSWDIQEVQMEGESGVTLSIIDEYHSSNIQGDQMEGESGVSRSIIDELHSSDIVKWMVQVVFVEVSLIKFILRISKRSYGR